MSDSIAGSSHSECQEISEIKNDECDVIEPENKKIKLSVSVGAKEKLEQRLGGILCCAVCLDLPSAAVYQCSNGHLMCAACITHLLADARIKDESATCPTCRVEFSKQSASRNLAVEKAISELPIECQYCNNEFSRNTLERHEKYSCEKRITTCKFNLIGCSWKGSNHEYFEHEKVCSHPNKTGVEILEALKAFEQKNEEEKKFYDGIFELLSFEKIAISDIQMKPYRTDEYFHKLFYETSRFSAFNYQWIVKARINSFQSNPTHSSERDLTYQLILKNKPALQLTIYYLIVKGPFSDMKVKPKVYKFDFTGEECESPYTHLPLEDTSECNRLLAAKTINFRLFMFMVSK